MHKDASELKSVSLADQPLLGDGETRHWLCAARDFFPGNVTTRAATNDCFIVDYFLD